MKPDRILRAGCAGEDVLRVKQRLFALGCYDPRIAAIHSDVFGRDTVKAVLAFQLRSGLEPDGIVGPLTCSALFAAELRTATDRKQIPSQIGDTAAEAILDALDGAGVTRRGIVLDALAFAFDAARPREYPVSLYIRGGNLYNAELAPNRITLERIAAGAKRQPEFYDGGRREMMERAVRENPEITGADCSGGVVGLLRHARVVASGFDLAADGFASNANYRRTEKSAMIPADLLHRSGHIGLYAGGGYAIEWMGGAYGCQLTRLETRYGWNFVRQTTDRFGGWTGFLHPIYY